MGLLLENCLLAKEFWSPVSKQGYANIRSTSSTWKPYSNELKAKYYSLHWQDKLHRHCERNCYCPQAPDFAKKSYPHNNKCYQVADNCMDPEQMTPLSNVGQCHLYIDPNDYLRALVLSYLFPTKGPLPPTDTVTRSRRPTLICILSLQSQESCSHVQ